MADVSKRTDWEEMKKEVIALIKRLQQKPEEERRDFDLEPGSILNTYREGDLTFGNAVAKIKEWRLKSVLRKLKEIEC